MHRRSMHGLWTWTLKKVHQGSIPVILCWSRVYITCSQINSVNVSGYSLLRADVALPQAHENVREDRIVIMAKYQKNTAFIIVQTYPASTCCSPRWSLSTWWAWTHVLPGKNVSKNHWPSFGMENIWRLNLEHWLVELYKQMRIWLDPGFKRCKKVISKYVCVCRPSLSLRCFCALLLWSG